MIILSLNAGSSSLKFSLYNYADNDVSLLINGTEEKVRNFTDTSKNILEKIKSFLRENNLEINAIGCRVVHGGNLFSQTTIMDFKKLEDLKSLNSLAPLHNKIDSEIIETCIEVFDKIPVIAVFDTTFHYNLPKISTTYALPIEFSEKYNLRRYGFHGIAHQSVSEKLLGYLNKDNSRIITCHLGNGSSLCAIQNGKSIDTSMGFTPAEGLIMGTRSGDLDPGLILYLVEECGLKITELDHIINHKSGLLGLSQLSSDVRDLELAAKDNQLAKFALEAFIYRIAKYIGAYYVVLGGLDAIAFSGGIGENSSFIRQKICEKINCLGVNLDQSLNNKKDDFFCITNQESLVPVWVIKADENIQIAKEVFLKT